MPDQVEGPRFPGKAAVLPTSQDTRKARSSPAPGVPVLVAGKHGGMERNLRGEESVYYLANVVLLIPWIYPLSFLL